MSSTLSRREMEVAVLAAEYKTNREIGSVMGITENTVKLYMRNILHKTGARNRTELVSKWLSKQIPRTEETVGDSESNGPLSRVGR